jgi:quercetin dioxygenase-like cupin family protein
MDRKRTAVLVGGAVVVATATYVGSVRATPSSGFTATTIAKGYFGDDIEVFNHVVRDSGTSEHGKDVWLSMQKTKGPSDLYVQSNVVAPGGSTGWHSHPGHSLIVVTAGAVTNYESDDPSCSPTTYTAGMAFVDHGGDHSHLLRNEGSVEARTVAVQLIPAGAARRIEAAAPANCPF